VQQDRQTAMIASTLDAFLNSYAFLGQGLRPSVANVVRAVASAALNIRAIMSNVGPGATDAILPRSDADPRRVL
jgi:hypothetical protein